MNQEDMAGLYNDMPADLAALLDKAQAVAAPDEAAIRRYAGLIDHTSLRDDGHMTGAESPQEIETLCQQARKGQTAAVCVYPNHVKQAADLLAGTNVAIATVNNFPHGSDSAEEAAAQAEEAIENGATEIDTVIDYQSSEKEELFTVSEKLRITGDICHERDVPLKIILKASIYESYKALYDAAYFACCFCRDRDFIKTCTGKMPEAGFGSGEADVSTLPMGAIVMKAVADYNRNHETNIGVKISGGVKTAADCAQYEYLVHELMGAEAFTAGRFRFGASSLIGNLQADLTPGNDDKKPAAKTAGPSSSY